MPVLLCAASRCCPAATRRRRLAGASFGQLEAPAGSGSIGFWRVVSKAAGSEPLRLVNTSFSLPVLCGMHPPSSARRAA